MMNFPALEPHSVSNLTMEHEKGGSILLVEDDPWLRQLLRVGLESRGYVCVEAQNGGEGLEQLKRHAVDIVITDQQMPVMSGSEFIEIMQNRYEREAPPVILVSGLHDSVLPTHLKQLNISAIFHKPYSLDDLLHSVASIIQQSHAR